MGNGPTSPEEEMPYNFCMFMIGKLGQITVEIYDQEELDPDFKTPTMIETYGMVFDGTKDDPIVTAMLSALKERGKRYDFTKDEEKKRAIMDGFMFHQPDNMEGDRYASCEE